MLTDVNYLTILAVAVAFMVLGFLWYGPLFGKQWMKLVGWTGDEKMDSAQMAKTYGLTYVGSVVMVYVLAQLVNWTNAATYMEGATVGAIAWFGFVATTKLNDVLYGKGKSWNLYLLETGYTLTALLIGGAILAVWK